MLVPFPPGGGGSSRSTCRPHRQRHPILWVIVLALRPADVPLTLEKWGVPDVNPAVMAGWCRCLPFLRRRRLMERLLATLPAPGLGVASRSSDELVGIVRAIGVAISVALHDPLNLFSTVGQDPSGTS